MKKVNDIYNETMEEIKKYNPDEVFERIVSDLNKNVGRKIEEFEIDLSNSVGHEKTTKKTSKLKEFLAYLLIISLFISCVGCSKVNEKPEEDRTTFDSYKSLLGQFEHDLMVEARSDGYDIGYSIYGDSMKENGNGVTSISDHDILDYVASFIDSENWYYRFHTNYSIVGEDGMNDYKYSVAQMVYEGLIAGLGYEGLYPEYLDEFLEQMIGKNIVLEYCEELDEMIYNIVDRELTEKEKVHNIITLVNYYRTKGKGRILN